MQQAIEYTFRYMLLLTPALIILGVVTSSLRKLFGGCSASLSEVEQIVQARRATYLEHLAQHHQIEPDGYDTDHAGTSEPDWVQPVYAAEDTYEQPPARWASANTHHQLGRRGERERMFLDDRKVANDG